MPDAQPTDQALALWAGIFTEAGRLKQGARFLDVGGGTGVLAAALAERSGAEGFLCDPNPAVGGAIPSVRAAAEALPFADAAFDAVLMSHVLHHLAAPRRTLLEAARVLKHGGRLVVRMASHQDLFELPHAHLIPHLLSGILAVVPDLSNVEGWLTESDLAVASVERVLTPQNATLENYASDVTLQAWREWAMNPGGGSDPREDARSWVLSEFREAPPVPETLFVAVRT